VSEYYKLVIMGRPVAKSNMYGVRVIGNMGVIYTKKELEDFELTLGGIASKVIPDVLKGLHSIYVRVYQYGKRTVDIDNTFKAILDSLDNSKTIKRGKRELKVCETGIENDKMFQLIIGERVECENKDDERLEILIAPYEGLMPFVKLIVKEYGE
jgi:Holliday junction resolvase RusA-like endonuclease